ncbi:MAG TPA: hypothetical protein ENH75_12955 [archaeon]|nr:hypothetical protein [archaeon]
MVKIVSSLRNFRDRTRASISIKTSNFLLIAAIILIVTLAILLRLSPLIHGIRLIKAFDPWIQWYNAEYLSEHSFYEYFNWVDTKSWYPEGFNRGGLRPGLTFTVVAIYKIFNFFGVPVSLYDVCYFFPAFMGGLTVLVIYFLGKEILNRGTGLFAAFFLAFNPGYLQRTTAGFFDNETIGVFATLMTFLFFIKAVKSGKFVHAILGGIFLGYLSLSWGGYQFVFLIFPIICFILVLTDKFNEKILISYAGVQGTGLLIFSLYTKFDYSNLISSLEIGGIFFFTVLLLIFHIIQKKKKDHPNFYKNLLYTIKWTLIPGILILAIILWVAPQLIPFGFGARFWTILNPLFRNQIALVASVAEQMPSAWSVFYYNTLIPLLLVPLGLYFCFKRLAPADIFLIAFLILMYYFTGSMIRIILIFAPAAALMGAYGLVSILKIFGSFIGESKVGVSRKRIRQLRGTLGNSEVAVVYIIVGILCYAQVAHAALIATEQMSQVQMVPGAGAGAGGELHDWEEVLTYMRTNLKGTDVVVSWWDYGYWLTPVGNVTTVNDNATKNQTRIGLTGMALMQTSEVYSAKAFRKLGADYVLVYFGALFSGLGGDEGKWPWMIRIPNDNYEKYKQMGMEEDNWADNSVFDESEYQNDTNGLYEDKWFESTLVKLMFFGMETNPDSAQNFASRNYATEINRRVDDDGDTWKSHIPDRGLYDLKAFIPEYFSLNGLVKLYKVDYTVLDSSFSISNAEVFDDGHATFKIKNTGKKELEITQVNINNEEYNFVTGQGNSSLKEGEEDLVWINTETRSTPFLKDDVVNLNVTAKSKAFAGNDFIFNKITENFFVKEAEEDEIKINYKNSRVIHNNTTDDVILEVENIGDNIVLLDRFYITNDTVENRFNNEKIEYISGSSILGAGDKATIYLPNSTASFTPFNKIGVATKNNFYDEVLMTSNIENYALSILSDERIVSPEVLASLNSKYRNHIPVDFNKTFAYTYDNGSTIMNIHVKNTGDRIIGLESIYLTESLIEVEYEDYYTKSGTLTLEINEEDVIIVDATDYVNGNVNEEVLLLVTGSFGTTVASNIGYIHTVRDEQDIQIIDSLENINTSFIYANEKGKLLIKNTGNEDLSIEHVYLNGTLASNIEYSYGGPYLGVQDSAILTFDIPNLIINKTNDVIVNVTTTSSLEVIKTLKAFVDSPYYNITIDDGGTSSVYAGNLTILITNEGSKNITINSVYINNTFISLNGFYPQSFNISVGNSLILTINMTLIEAKIGAINIDDTLVILVRTEEGAEYLHEEIVN